MISKTKIGVVFIISQLIVLSSCLKVETYPDEPVIEYKSFEVFQDSAIVTVSFTDGDGDIGLSTGDTLGDYAPGSFFHYNAYLEYYEYMNGEWVKGTADPAGNNFPTADTIVFTNRLPNITPIGQNKALKGDIKLTLEPNYFNPISNHNDSIKYKVYIIDRALNISNTIETEVITP
ncbi:MAG: hypothetical protein N4A35_08755 [Flavobacteriales bacterium]|jgi:hypothetical protein|nr:hypothetical protein [Flavobacteriales bacterium]